MRTDENEYIKDIFQLIKSLLNFCEYDLSINKMRSTYHVLLMI